MFKDVSEGRLLGKDHQEDDATKCCGEVAHRKSIHDTLENVSQGCRKEEEATKATEKRSLCETPSHEFSK